VKESNGKAQGGTGQPAPGPRRNTAGDDPDCIFCRIVRGEIPSSKVYEDDEVLAFRDIHPAAPVHVLVIPKLHIASLYEAEDRHAGVLGRMLLLAGKIARQEGATDGFRSIVNTGRVGGQEVYHVHLHVIAGPQPVGPMLVRRLA
jgi:histidine triad (HIT) family protein